MIAAWCGRCRKPADIDPDELDDGGHGDPDLLPVLIPPDGWMADPDDADGGIICGGCATFEDEMNDRGDRVVIEHELGIEPD